MAELADVLKGRRSIRNYQDREVPEEVLDQVLEAVQWSPSWANTQCWEVIVVKNPGHQAEAPGDLVPGQPGHAGHGGGAGDPGPLRQTGQFRVL